MPFRTQDIDTALRIGGVDATFGAVTARVLVDRVARRLLPGGGASVAGRVTVLTMKTGSFPGLLIGSVITINTTGLRVTKLRGVDDGGTTVAECEAA